MTVTLADGVATLTHAGHLVATARPGIVAPLKTDAVDLAAAADAETRYEALAGHPSAPASPAAPIAIPRRRSACGPAPWPTARGGMRAGLPAASPSLVWAALDCPAVGRPGSRDARWCWVR